jgi:5-methylcytosine-specific restriction protein A
LAVFGPEAEGFIHVHHLIPLSTIGTEYLVDPINDLRPVCPNCHAVIHLGGGSRSIDEVREMLENSASHGARIGG